MENPRSGSDASIQEPPPSYEQSLGHRRLESTEVIPEYSPDVAASRSGSTGPPHRYQNNRIFRLPSTDLTRGRSPEVVTDDDSISMTSSVDSQMNAYLKLTLPPMHMCMATTSLVINFIIPGLGTMLAGLGVFCCTKSGHWMAKEKCLSCIFSLLIGILQLILVPVILLGWIWSVIWGFALLGVSLDDYHGMKNEDETDEEANSTARPRSSHLFRIPRLSETRQAARQLSGAVSPEADQRNASAPNRTGCTSRP